MKAAQMESWCTSTIFLVRAMFRLLFKALQVQVDEGDDTHHYSASISYSHTLFTSTSGTPYRVIFWLHFFRFSTTKTQVAILQLVGLLSINFTISFFYHKHSQLVFYSQQIFHTEIIFKSNEFAYVTLVISWGISKDLINSVSTSDNGN